ncbi:ABC transporter substrate-binding protein [Zeaxanthinibacter enoshimensis]|uniref:Iron complex transport system substrate-binding protein n=1 Tax=Zeaxanthinibacter enoshimensis TaxID=392009 RepID=A0A4R6TGS9_9FLAO|nr:ABC transporter substrate-binding protein [Zeaxanthinibacter enoshimensis]TDQ29457.1 iron complex transport system substrate-binding protein [Zeaxanthinibacter enoshimensis]
MKRLLILFVLVSIISCKPEKKQESIASPSLQDTTVVTYADGLSISREANGISLVEVRSPWPGAEKPFRYLLVPREQLAFTTFDKDAYDAIIATPVERIVVTSTTHIPALESLGVEIKLVGFPETRYISSEKTRKRIEAGQITDVGSNEAVNTEKLLALQPDLVVGFSIDNRNQAYDVIQRSGIPVVYNGDWTESSPLGKAEWIKFFAPFFGKEQEADSIFSQIEQDYLAARKLAADAPERPTVLCGALYKDIWYLPGGNSWMARFLEDANANYLWSDNEDSGSLSLSVESVLETAKNADSWVSPSQYTSYKEMGAANRHYSQFRAFRERQVYTFARTTGETGGLLYYELAPNRPDLVLKDLVSLLHPGLLPDHQPFFFKPLAD